MSKQIWFNDNIWNIIKEFAGYSNDYPTDLPYFTFMLPFRARNFSQTKMKWKKVKNLEDYIDKLWDLSWDLELDLQSAFNPTQYKNLNQIRIEWDKKYGKGNFDEDF